MEYEVKSWDTLCLNAFLEMTLPIFRSSNSFTAKSLLNLAHTVSMGLRSPLLLGKFMEIMPTFLYSFGWLMNFSLSCQSFNLFASPP